MRFYVFAVTKTARFPPMCISLLSTQIMRCVMDLSVSVDFLLHDHVLVIYAYTDGHQSNLLGTLIRSLNRNFDGKFNGNLDQMFNGKTTNKNFDWTKKKANWLLIYR